MNVSTAKTTSTASVNRCCEDSVHLTVLVAAKNERVNIEKCLRSLEPAEQVVVIDSNSSDGTRDAARALGAEVVRFAYAGGYPKKRQWALGTLDLQTPWVLLVDADEEIPPRLWDEIRDAIRGGVCDAYLITKGFHFMGRRFRFGGFSHSAVLLFRRGCARFERLVDENANALDMEVHERLVVEGPVGRLRTPLIHKDYKGLEAYVDRHNRYSTWEAAVRFGFFQKRESDVSIHARPLGNVQERRRFLKKIACRLPGEPWLWFIYHYVLRLGFLEGRPGLIAAQIRAQYVANVRAKVYELRRKRSIAGT